jgi:8-oxo-dGTP diphosphatase
LKRDDVVEVAAALLFDKGRLLITQRRPDDHLGGLWEFPGGKREQAETFEACLRRELQEELGIEAEPVEVVERLTHVYPEKTVYLVFFRCIWRRGEPKALGCQALAWVQRTDLRRYTFPDADSKLLALLEADQRFWTDPDDSSSRRQGGGGGEPR